LYNSRRANSFTGKVRRPTICTSYWKPEIDIRVGDYVKTAKEGALIGQAALIEERPRAANAVAKSACRLAKIDRQRFDFLVQQHPQLATYAMKSLIDHLRHVTRVGQ